jgi:hypothetical protein
MSTCNRLDLQTLGSQPILPKNLPDHWCRETSDINFKYSIEAKNNCLFLYTYV